MNSIARIGNRAHLPARIIFTHHPFVARRSLAQRRCFFVMSTVAAPEDQSHAPVEVAKEVSKRAQVIDGTAIAKSIRDEVAQRISSLRAQYPRFQPHLVIVQAGARPDSTTYVRMKAKAAAETGIKYTHVHLEAEASVQEIVSVVEKLNRDESVSGILVQLPLGDHITAEGERQVTEAISPDKDVDGYVGLMLSCVG